MSDPAKDFTSLLFQTLQRWAEQVVPPDSEPVTEDVDAAEPVMERPDFHDVAKRLDAELAAVREQLKFTQELTDKQARGLLAGDEIARKLRADLAAKHTELLAAQEKIAGDPYQNLRDATKELNEVISRQILNFGSTTGLARAADIRRRQLSKYSIEHDATEHGAAAFVTAAVALLRGGSWPFNRATYNEIVQAGDEEVHAAALLMAAHDVRNFDGPVRVNK